MPSLKDIRKRINSVKSTQKITRAMKMVAGARLNRAQQRIVAMRPYAVTTANVVWRVADTFARHAEDEADTEGVIAAEDVLHPLLLERPEKRALYVVLSSDRGLCGAFNANVNKQAEAVFRERSGDTDIVYATIGRKGRDFLLRRDRKVLRNFEKIYDRLDIERAREVSSWLVRGFLAGDFDSVYLVFNEFRSAISQKPVIEKLLPLQRTTDTAALSEDALAPFEYSFEPNPVAVLERIVPMYVEIALFRALLESQASEYGARMTAMDAATRNAKDMIGRLTLLYNRARQAAITKELMEIIGGAEALKG